jgi:Carboxypeptidase regulatory-like domain/TonB-dependent Receptor Plug Domain
VLSLVLIFLGSVFPLVAQVSTGTILGVVTDTSGAAIADAEVQVKSSDTGAIQTTTTDTQGRFTVPSLNVGQYEVSASKAGFQTVVRRSVTLTVGGQFVVDMTLPVGSAQQTVTVEAQVSQVDTSSSTVANLVEQKQMVDLPLNGRNFQQLITLAPGVQVAQTATTSFYGKGDTYSIAGGRPEGQAYLLDGTDITNFFNHGTGGGSLGTSLGIDAIAEFQTLTNTYSAQFGGNGAVVNAVSKSGTNAFHGGAFEFLRNSALDARDFFEGASPAPFRRNQFGGSLGGPIKKDRAFFFFNYEGVRLAKTLTNPVIVPDANAHNGDLPCAVAGTAAPCNTSTGLAHVGFASQELANVMALYPVAPNNLATGFGTVSEAGSQVGHENYFLGRFDYMLSTNDSLFARYVYDHGEFDNPFPSTNIPGWNDSEPTSNQYITVEEKHIVSASMINIARVSFVRTRNAATTLGSTPALQFYPHLGGQDGNIAITGLSGLGPSALAPYLLLQNKYGLSDDVYITHGAHTIKIGIGLTRLQTYENQPFSAAGSFTFASLLGFMQGSAIRYGGAFPVGAAVPFDFKGVNPDAYRAWRETLIMPYINDDWKVNSKLTLNIGLRFDFGTNPHSIMNNMLVITNPPFNSVGGTPSTGFTLVNNVWAHNPNSGNWGPRFGFAYDPFSDHKTSIRGGFGDTHNVVAPRVWTSGYVTGPPFPSVIITPGPANPVINFPNPFVGKVNPPLPSNGQTVDYNQDKAPALYQWNLNVQRELWFNTILTVGYVGSHGSHLMTQSDQNPPVPVTDSNGVMHFGTPGKPNANGVTTGGLSYARWSPNFGTINALQADGNSSYNSLQVNGVHRFSHNLQAQLAYTWSHCIDDGSASSGLETGGGPRSNPYDFSSDRGSCTFDLRHSFRANSVYLLPFKGNRFIEGWQLSGVLSRTTGAPLLLTTGFDRELVGGSSTVNQRPSLAPGFTADSIEQDIRTQWYNPAGFVLQPEGTPGNLGRDVIRGPKLFNVDVSLLKDTKITERLSAQFRAEFFNVLNHENFGTPNLNIFSTANLKPSSDGLVHGNNGSAGLILNTNPGTNPRQIQFALRLIF